MQNQLETVSSSYDKAIDLGKSGINPYNDLPEFITNDPDYHKWKTENENGTGSEFKSINNYLLPNSNMKFIDLGCALNLMFKGYDKWPSKYYGIDISRKTIDLLNNFVAKKKLSIGSLFCGSMHKTPFKDSYFDIGACVGILEYYEKDFLEKVIIEIHRIMKPNGKFVLDIPNIGSPSCRIMFLIEEYLGRPCKFNIIPKEFEEILKDYFEIIENDKDNEFMGLMYFLKCKK